MPRSSPTSRQRGDEARIAADVAECGEPGSVPLPAIERHRRRRVLWAEQGPYGLALVAAPPAWWTIIPTDRPMVSAGRWRLRPLIIFDLPPESALAVM